jgi:hypothetical protein
LPKEVPLYKRTGFRRAGGQQPHTNWRKLIDDKYHQKDLKWYSTILRTNRVTRLISRAAKKIGRMVLGLFAWVKRHPGSVGARRYDCALSSFYAFRKAFCADLHRGWNCDGVITG